MHPVHKMPRFLTLSLCALSLAACTTLEPNIDTKPIESYDLVDKAKVDMQQYEKDYEACATIANQDGGSAGKIASRTMGTVADRATFGLVGQRAAKDADRMSVLKRCLSGRGYNVLR